MVINRWWHEAKEATRQISVITDIKEAIDYIVSAAKNAEGRDGSPFGSPAAQVAPTSPVFMLPLRVRRAVHSVATASVTVIAISLPGSEMDDVHGSAWDGRTGDHLTKRIRDAACNSVPS